MVTIRRERKADVAPREALLDVSYGPIRFSKTSERLREGRRPGLSFVAASGRRLVGTVRLWDVSAGRAGRRCCSDRSRSRPTAASAASARRWCRSRCVKRPGTAMRAVLLVGDAPYYGRFGFSNEKTAALWLPGPYEPHRLLACELKPGALDGARGLISASGRPEQQPDLAALVAGLAGSEPTLAPRAA